MGERGQAAVEVALVLPLLALLALFVAQAGLIVRDQVLVTHVAREAARAAAVDPDPAAARTAAEGSARIDPDRLTVEVGPRGAAGEDVTVEVSYRSPTDLPLIGPLVGDVTVTAEATMRVE
jgi:hypothetical protein